MGGGFGADRLAAQLGPLTSQQSGLNPDAVAAFWAWWSGAKGRIAAAIADRTLGESPLVGEISDAVHGLHPDFAWELGPGKTAHHNLTITPEGNLQLRRLTAQWLASAPPADSVWEYSASRRAASGPNLEIGGKQFREDDFRIAWKYDQSRARFDVTLFHPHFKKSDHDLVRHVLFLTLDQALGEDDVERWIGTLDATTSQPREAKSLKDFKAAIATAQQSAKGEVFSLGQGQSPEGRPVLVMVNMALKQIDHLDHVFHLVVVIGLRNPNPQGMPVDPESKELDEAEDRLLAALGDDAIQIGHVTWHGRREIHLYVRDPALAEATTRRWEESAGGFGSVSHTLSFDPEWTASKQGIYAALAPRAAH